MKRVLYVACLLFLLPSPLVAQYDWPFVIVLRPSPMWINSQTEPDAPFFEDTDGLRYYCVTHNAYHKCVRQLTMLGLSDEDCSPQVSPACGHVKGVHDPPDFLTSTDFYRIGGYLTDPRTPDTPLKTIFVGNGAGDPVTLPWMYTAGQVTGTQKFRVVATNPPPTHFFLTQPYGFCESTSSCTVNFTIRLYVPGLEELPAPPWISPVNGQPIPYLRCGLTPCADGVDNPYNWPAHPRVHWGTSKAISALTTLAERWYELCSTWNLDADGQLFVAWPQALVVDDISLPLGGLFDATRNSANWRPTVRPTTRGIGHRTHRLGTEIDLSAASVPFSNNCGPRPSEGTWDQNWKKTELWKNKDILKGLNLLKTSNDPGHLRWKQ